MNTQKIANIIISSLIAIVGFFLIRTYNRLDSIDVRLNQAEQSIELQKQKADLKFQRLEEKIDDLKFAIVELTTELKTRKENNK